MKLNNKYNIPKRIVEQAGKTHRPVKDRISVTDLIDCPRKRTMMLENWDDIELDVSDFLQTIIGISVHDRQAKIMDPDVDSETKFEDKIESITIVGRADNYDKVEKVIGETKVKAVGCLEHLDFLKSVEAQLNVYAWQRRKRDFEVKRLRLDVYYRDWIEWKAEQARVTKYAVMKEGRKTALKVFDSKEEAKTWMNDKVGSQSDTFYIEEREAKGDYPILPVQWDIEIPLWTFEVQQEYVEDQVMYHTLAPMDCSEECQWKNKLCCKKYCNVRSVCKLWQNSKSSEVKDK
jgi:hypothetical protein